VIVEVHEKMAMPTVTSTPFARPFCMKDGKSCREMMALKNSSGSASRLACSNKRRGLDRMTFSRSVSHDLPWTDSPFTS